MSMKDGIVTTKAEVKVEGKGKVKVTATFTFQFVDRICDDVTSTWEMSVNADKDEGALVIDAYVSDPKSLAKFAGWRRVVTDPDLTVTMNS